MSVAYKIPETQISHNRFDDEIIAVNLATGSYFSFHNTAAELWSLLERGPGSADSLAAAFANAPVCASQEIAIFLQRLHDEGLLTAGTEEPVQTTSMQAYSTPVVEEFDELRELLLADIVHDTDEAGWPHLIKT
ncbi:MAG: PqqD family protein [Xanthobacteraceae bacterium]|nr:PqqD family protein [Bradyrhizobium sp.]